MKTKIIKIGNKKIGGNNPVLVQSMCNTKTWDIKKTVAQIKKLEKAGCEIIRVAVPDEKSAQALKKIKEKINIPLIADIHFDYKLAVLSAKYCDKIRINPGNIGSKERFKKVIQAAKENNIPIRIGVNLGSLEKEVEKKYGRCAKAMAESALSFIKFCEENNFYNIVVSLKASDVKTTIEANRLFSKKSKYPLHIGITEAGTGIDSIVKSSIGVGSLLLNGVGNTIRVSLTDDPQKEIEVAYSILKTLELRNIGINIISCPTCGRTHSDLIKIVKQIQEKTKHIKKPLTIAIMGCEVNGPGEAKNADIGVALSKNNGGYLFKKGRIVKKVDYDKIVNEIIIEVDKF